MSEPNPLTRIPPAVALALALPTWCSSCEIHMATTWHPLCPICDDERTKEPK